MNSDEIQEMDTSEEFLMENVDNVFQKEIHSKTKFIKDGIFPCFAASRNYPRKEKFRICYYLTISIIMHVIIFYILVLLGWVTEELTLKHSKQSSYMWSLEGAVILYLLTFVTLLLKFVLFLSSYCFCFGNTEKIRKILNKKHNSRYVIVLVDENTKETCKIKDHTKIFANQEALIVHSTMITHDIPPSYKLYMEVYDRQRFENYNEIELI